MKPIDRPTQIITQDFSENHHGLDLRSVDIDTGLKQNILAVDRMTVLRHKLDSYGNNILVCAGHNTGYIFKYIHIKCNNDFQSGDLLIEGSIIGQTETFDTCGRGNSFAHHLHFEILTDDVITCDCYVDPKKFFLSNGIKYDYK